MENSQNDSGQSRRDFIRKSTLTAAAVATTTNIFKTPVYGQNQAPSANVTGANNKIVVAHIGVGGQGTAHLKSVHDNAGENNVVQAAVCDVSKTRIAEAKQNVSGTNVEGYEDHRKLLERKDIDAVVVATHDIWHAPVSIDALNAGKHVYCEKPMTRYLGEAFAVHDAVKKTGKVFQVGSQICSDARWHEAAKWIKSGKIGPLVMGQDSYMRNTPAGEWNYKIMQWATKDDIDWNRWLGQVKKKVDFSADHYFRWRKYYPYCAGLLGDLFPHRLHPFMLATGNPEFPRRVASIGTTPVHSDKNTPGTPPRDVPENVGLLVEFPSALTLMMTAGTVNEVGLTSLMRGHKGTIYFGGDRIEVKPERPFADEVEPEVKQGLKPSGEKISEMEKNWFNCIRSGQAPYANIDLAIRVQTVISLAEIADRQGVVCFFDEKTRKIKDGTGREIPMPTYGSDPLS